MTRLAVSLGTSTVTVSGLDLGTSLAAWSPFIRVTAAGLGGAGVANIVLAPRADCTGPAGSGSLVELHQGHVGRLVASGEQLDVDNESLGVHYHVRVGVPPRVTLCVDLDRPDHLLDALQVVRGLLLADQLRSGLAPLHGAVLSLKGDGVLLVGPKGAGKTSFALAAVRSGRAELVTNDKALWRGPDGVALGLPYAVALAPGTLAQLPELAGDGERWSGGKRMVWPVEVARLLGGVLRPEVPVREVWLCELDLDRGGVDLSEDIAPAARAAGLAAAGDFAHTMSPQWLYTLLGWHLPPRNDLALADLARLPWRRCTGNPWGTWPSLERTTRA